MYTSVYMTSRWKHSTSMNAANTLTAVPIPWVLQLIFSWPIHSTECTAYSLYLDWDSEYTPWNTVQDCVSGERNTKIWRLQGHWACNHMPSEYLKSCIWKITNSYFTGKEVGIIAPKVTNLVQETGEAVPPKPILDKWESPKGDKALLLSVLTILIKLLTMQIVWFCLKVWR